MRVIRTVVLSLLFIAGVFLASANVHDVSLVFLPDLPVTGWPEVRAIELPLFVLVLGALVVGIMLGAFGALFEQARLRRTLRRMHKEKDRLAAELGGVQIELERSREEAARWKDELERARVEMSTGTASKDPASAVEEAEQGTLEMGGTTRLTD